MWRGRLDYHCFISYTTREDEIREVLPLVDAYCSALRARGVTPYVFFDRLCMDRGPKSHHALCRQLERAIRLSGFTVSFISPSYLDSEWCRFEVSETLREHRQRRRFPDCEFAILPILWKRCDPDHRRGLMSRRLVDVSGAGWQSNSAKLLDTVAELVAETAPFIEAWSPYCEPRTPHWWPPWLWRW